MKKSLVFLFITLLAVSGFASMTRYNVLNMQGYIGDNTGSVWANPAYLAITFANHGKDMVGFEMGFDNPTNNIDTQKWGYLFKNGQFGIGINRMGYQGLLPFSQAGFAPDSIDATLIAYSDDSLLAPFNLIDLLWATEMGGGSAIGFDVNFGMWGENVTDHPNDTTTNEADMSSMRFGLLFGYGSMPMDFTIGFDYLTGTVEGTQTIGSTSTGGNFKNNNMNFNVGFKMKQYPNAFTTVILPLVGLSYQTRKGTYEMTGTGAVSYDPSYERTDINLALGSGVVWAGSSWKAGIAGELGYGMHTVKRDQEHYQTEVEDKWTDIIFPRLKAGAEAVVFPWLTARGGMTYTLTTTSDKVTTTVAGTSTDTEESSKFLRNMNVNLGIGVNFGQNFVIDTEVSEDLLYNGPYLLSGAANGTNPMNLRVSATYYF